MKEGGLGPGAGPHQEVRWHMSARDPRGHGVLSRLFIKQTYKITCLIMYFRNFLCLGCSLPTCLPPALSAYLKSISLITDLMSSSIRAAITECSRALRLSVKLWN